MTEAFKIDIEVESESPQVAEQKVTDDGHSYEHILDTGNFTEVSFEVEVIQMKKL